MRQELKSLGSGKRYTFIGTFKRKGEKRGWEGAIDETILLVNVIEKSTGKKVTDHIWFTMGSQFYDLGELQEGDKIEFNARVGEYEKGYHGRKAEEMGEERWETDYRLERPTKIKKVEKVAFNQIQGIFKTLKNREEFNILKALDTLYFKADYEKAYHILMDYFHSIPEEDKIKVDKDLKECGL